MVELLHGTIKDCANKGFLNVHQLQELYKVTSLALECESGKVVRTIEE